MADKASDGRDSYHHGNLRAALIGAAREELGERGLEKFSLRGCARRAGVSHAAPAHYFKSADALLGALAGQGFAELGAAMRRRIEGTTTAHERLVASGEGYVTFATENPALFKLMFSSDRPDMTDKAIAEPAETAFQILRSTIEAVRAEALAPGSAVDEATDIAAAWSIVHGLSHLLIEGIPIFPIDADPDRRRRAVRATIERIVRGLG